MLTDTRFWAGILAGFLLMYGYHWWLSRKAAQ